VTGPGEPRPPENGARGIREPGTGKPGTGAPDASEPGNAVMGTGEPGTAAPGGPRAPGDGRAGYLDMRVSEFLDVLAAARPDPGGGSAAALAVALAAALCAMTAELSARRLAHAPELAADARGLLRRAAPLAQADADAYADVLAAQRAPAESAGEPREQRVSAALAQASAVPLEVAEIGDRVAALAAEIAARGNPAVRGDALTAARLAASAAQASAGLVRINLAGTPDDPRPARASHLAARAARLAAQAASHAAVGASSGN
jgi:formiminotetrahydrofolate cyclodeaminase